MQKEGREERGREERRRGGREGEEGEMKKQDLGIVGREKGKREGAKRTLSEISKTKSTHAHV